ncbi:MAG: twitching motility protein PilT [Anaerostipes sp.]|uniref:twitching motility protein PilT n=1 Tax=Anaerostipes sp. 992a TaxID=1261637 RepID=UPI0009520F15|nr:twitching motility protein PilT [Anaerostipes sp. 992a]MCI5951688.1 twitching motility protein PilT [Anaerostipes sp.]MDD5969042.1 twitching motility protein PilT [Anaerostipes sp.]OLR62252.1 twitching motility protein PilT [Anaerostipes sp. 992a]
MVEIIAGVKGKGKTKVLIEKVNDAVKVAKGDIVYIDKSNKHMYELSNRIRFIVSPEYGITNTDMFLGFLAGILSQNYDIETIYLESFLTIANVDVSNDADVEATVAKIQEISEKYDVDFVISASRDKSDMPESIQGLVTVSL